MRLIKRIFIVTLLGLISIPAAADEILTCLETKKPKDQVFSYVIKSTKSARLASDITYKNSAGQNIIISSLQVAQYVTSKPFLYMQIDDVTESPIISFYAFKPGRAKKFHGYVSEINPATNQVTSQRKVSCTLALL